MYHARVLRCATLGPEVRRAVWGDYPNLTVLDTGAMAEPILLPCAGPSRQAAATRLRA